MMLTKGLAVVIPSKTTDYLSRLFHSMNQSQFGWFSSGEVIIYVVDSGIDRPIPFHWRVYGSSLRIIPYDQEQFIFARAVNLGVTEALKVDARGTMPEAVLVMNDDTEVLSQNFFASLLVALRDKTLDEVGIFSPVIHGGVGNREQAIKVPEPFKVLVTHRTICFVAALIRVQACHKLDERYTGYGWEDNDYCRVIRDAGWKTAVLASAAVRHGSPEVGVMHGTFGRGRTPDEMRALFLEGQRIYLAKWGSDALEKDRQADPPTML